MKARAILRPLMGALLILLCASLLMLASLLLEPQWFLTSKTVGRAIQVFGRAFAPRWGRLDFKIISPGLFEKDIAFSTDDFCFANADGVVSGCFKTLSARFTIELSPTGVRVTKIALLDAKGGRLRFDEIRGTPPSSAKNAVEAFRLPKSLPATLRGLRIEKLSIDLPSIDLLESKGGADGSLHLGFDSARAEALELSARWARRDGGADRGRLDVSIVSDFFKNGRLTYVDAKGKFHGAGASAAFSAKAHQVGPDAVSLEAEASGRRKGSRFLFRGSGVQTSANDSMSGRLEVNASSGPIMSLRLDPINFMATKKEGAALPLSVHLNAAVRAEPRAFRSSLGFKSPKVVEGRFTLDARATPRTSQQDHFDAELALILNPYAGWYEAHAGWFAKASGRTSELRRARIQQRVDAAVSVPRFEDLVRFLARGPYAIPAPFDVLKGGLRASFVGRADQTRGRIGFVYQLLGDLAAGKQKLKFHVAGAGQEFPSPTKARAIETQATATLDDVALQLPHLDALKMPKATLDPRIKIPDPEESGSAVRSEAAWAGGTGSTSALDLSIETARPIVLYSDLAKTPVPVAVNLKYEKSTGRMIGVVSVKSFDVEFFRRNATIDHLTLTFRPDSTRVGLEGLITYKASEALIRIRLLGTVDKPQVLFESDPPLGQSDIIAMLVFDKSPDELDADQTATVANSQTAMSDEAFGLASLYLFASTPIQFVGFDSATQSYTIKFRIPGGETLSLNSDFDSTKSVELRKRLSRHFAIVSEAVNSQTQGNGVVTLLEWFTRY